MDTPIHGFGDRIVAIVPPAGDKLRAKTIVSRSNATQTGKYPSWKMGRMIQWANNSELNAFRLLDAEPRVLSFREYPLAIKLIYNGQARMHYPGLEVDLMSGRELWRVCTADQAVSTDETALTSLLASQLQSFGYTYRIITSESVALEPRLSIVRSLLRYGRKSITSLEREQMRRLLEEIGYVHWGTPDTGALGPRSRAIISRLTLEGVLGVPYHSPLESETIFTPTNLASY
ncbi:hypothetical protein SAMN05443245_4190 [Paraburkholderia fungorum]|uniref:TnsA endonuclease N-terminal domain-containing protein n=1 Tax=Paraburkholderia fungorum TaxID=134537 RepID=A0A1H1HRV8_9BURK|nr:hypothetical protein [Paraburkholderia fungorum]SDR27838.1 hypothetical protein SAMN05443245_4190 [Paraburkholderia fungorum]